MELIVRRFESRVGDGSSRDEVFKLDETSGLFMPPLPSYVLKLKSSIKEMIFMTGNKNKLTELKATLRLDGVELCCPETKMDLPEIQDPETLNIAQDKCWRARKKVQSSQPSGARVNESEKAILVEDNCLNFDALDGMPGPYVKWFLEAVGPEGLCRMLTGFSCKSAEAVCLYALMMVGEPARRFPEENDSSLEASKTVLFFRGVVRGRIVEPRRGILGSGWGWDPIFEEERSRLTFAEMGPESKSKFSHRAGALRVLKSFFEG